MSPDPFSEDDMPIVEYEVEGAEFPRLARDLPEGTRVELEYDSAYGGRKTVTGPLERIERRSSMTADEAYERGAARPGDVVVDDRIVRGSSVRSKRDRRRVGRAEFARVQVPRDRAIDHLSRHAQGYDVDAGDEVTYVQFWEGGHGAEATLPHIEGGERVDDRVEPRNDAARDSWLPLGP